MKEALQAIGEAILEDGRNALARFPLRLRECIDLGQRAAERLLDDDMASRRERLHRLVEVEIGGCADVDEIEVAREQVVIGGEHARNLVFPCQLAGALAVDVTERVDCVVVRKLAIGLDMVRTDACPDDADSDALAHSCSLAQVAAMGGGLT